MDDLPNISQDIFQPVDNPHVESNDALPVHNICDNADLAIQCDHNKTVLLHHFVSQYNTAPVHQEQIHYLYAPSHLNPTYEYGVSFERGTYIDYADRRHVFISGTASINNKGEIVHQGQVALQVERLWENVETLLKEADCTFDNVCHMLVYLRDIGDYNVVRKKFEQRFPQTPKIFLWAPVCRPGWLVEMECMATKPIVDQRFKSF